MQHTKNITRSSAIYRECNCDVRSLPFSALPVPRRRRQRRSSLNFCSLPLLLIPWMALVAQVAHGFVIQQQTQTQNVLIPQSYAFQTYGYRSLPRRSVIASSNTALHVWWYGGSESMEESTTTDSCELVAVRIERTSPNSRRIFGEIAIPARLQDVWNILTDYNRLSIHVPNLVDSRVERALSGGRQGDGQYQCRLYQKGAQKIIGFEFGASVTMDMKESIVTASSTTKPFAFDASAWSSASSDTIVRQERKITFTCVDSFFFREFDGEWNVKEMTTSSGEVETLLSYVVDVRPKGPVPVAALEWRIREDVPTNLRAVKKAALQLAALNPRTATVALPPSLATTTATGAITKRKPTTNASRLALAREVRGKVQWYKDETMETYLSNDNNNA